MNLFSKIEYRIYRWLFDPTLRASGRTPFTHEGHIELNGLPINQRKLVYVRIALYVLVTAILSAVIITVMNYV